ncbi:HEPN domain-containing protein [Paenibacillus cellulosilyticus]|uniref:HEPN domain-containing protein n=1 Tax=Paenibacillus cellulosilyticus TaxID=375489 RepID=UPI003CCC8D60
MCAYARGFLDRVNLQCRIKRLDEKYLQVILASSERIINTNNANGFYSRIVNTRNYYSHLRTTLEEFLAIQRCFGL